MISALEAKRLLHKGCEANLAHVVDKSTLEVVLGLREFSDHKGPRHIFAMTANEVQANLDTVTGTMFVFGTPV